MAPANGVKQEKTNDAIPPPRSRPSPIKREEKKKETPPPPPPTTYRDIPLFSTDSGPWITHLMKFAHHTRVDPSDVSQFIPPVKLNRKNPPRPKIPQPKPGDPVTDRYGKHMMGKDGKPLNWPAPGEDLSRIEEVIKPSGAASQPKAPGADQSLIAPGSNPATSGRPPKSRLFQKRVKEIHKAADHARKTMKEEHFPWVLEDFETSQEWESVRNPIPTGQKALEGWVEELKKKQALKLEEQGEQGQDGEDIKMESAVKPEPNPEEGSKDRGAPGSISHAPWIGKLEGDSDENSSSHHVLFVFDERGAGGFKVVPVTRMYKFLQKPKHSTLTYEQVEAEFQKFQKNKEVDRWMMRTKRGEGGPSSFAAVKADRDAWNGWGNVGGISLPSGSGSRGFGVPGGSSASSSRRRNLMAVHGGELLRDDDDDGIGSRRRRVSRRDGRDRVHSLRRIQPP
ncbi:hypothetical protein IE53DRAFT_372068 [Violaceomyces palustris]|uniref:Uncharacterized protein n=1 Tax=Violaceomyces palustris TaxID=1673888 RepID=A0ACD0NLW8_9BASI|nr:hypothetical protein IE53DRAFT_372068 [Violaceomyces palustris]